MKIEKVLDVIEEQIKDHEFLSTGFSLLDFILDGGFIRQELIIAGGATGCGKSYFAGQLLYNMALQGFKCAYFSLEISNSMIVSRLIGALAKIKPSFVRTNLCLDEQKSAKTEAIADLLALTEFLNFYDDCYDIEEIEKILTAHSYDFVVIDYLQNITSKNKKLDEYALMGHAARTLQQRAKQNNCVIFALSQLSNTVVKEENSTTPNFRGNGAIQHAADHAFRLEQDKVVPTDVSDFKEGSRKFSLISQKNRRGMSGWKVPFTSEYPGGLICEE